MMDKIFSATAKVCFVISAFLTISSYAFAQGLNWSLPQSISEAGQHAYDAEIAVSSDGTKATAVWRRTDGSDWIIQTASATISGNVSTWGSVTNLSQAGETASDVEIKLSSDGTKATAIWWRSNGTNVIIQTASATISGNTASWGTVSDLSDTGQDAGRPRIALSSDGSKATAVWHRSNGTNYIIQAACATISDNTASWSTVSDLSAVGQHANFPAVGLSSDGTRATAVWSRNNGTNYIIQSSSASIIGNSASWGTVSDLSATGASQNAERPQISVSSDATKATAIWQRLNGTYMIIQSASGTISGNTATWGSVTDLSADGQNAVYGQIAVSSDGTMATGIWGRWSGSNYTVQTKSATIAANAAAWGSLTNLTADGPNAAHHQIALSSDGTQASAIWVFQNSGNTIQTASASISSNSATWGSTTSLFSPSSDNTGEPRICLAPDGSKASAVWHRNVGTHHFIQTASARLYSISGTITEDGSGKSGVTVALSGDKTDSTTTDGSGDYVFYVTDGASYTVTPILSNYTLSPANGSGSISSADADHDFTATPVVTSHTVSGKLLQNGLPVGEAIVKLISSSGSSQVIAEVRTDQNGNYTFSDVSDGEYRIQAENQGLILDTASVTVSGSDQSNLDLNVEATSVENEVYSWWNTCLDIINVLELVNKSTNDLTASVTLYNTSGDEVSQVTVQISGQSQKDLILNELLSGIGESYGLVKVVFSHHDVDGRLSFYRVSTTISGAYDFASSVSLINPTWGTTHAIFNTFQVSTNPDDTNSLVPNWLSVGNLAASEKSFSVNFYNQLGTLIDTSTLTVPAYGRKDIDGGHATSGPNTVGLIEVVPNDSQAKYTALLSRYAERGHAGEYSYLIANSLQNGSGNQLILPVTNLEGTNNWIEITNVSTSQITATVKWYDANGDLLSTEQTNLPAKTQFHSFAGTVLSQDTSGTVVIETDSELAVLAGSAVYYMDSATGSVLSADYSMAREVYALDVFGSYNLFLNYNNTLRLINPTATSQTVTLTINPGPGEYTNNYSVAANGRVDLDLNSTDPLTETRDSYGVFSVSSSNAGSVLAEIVRSRFNSQELDSVNSLPLR